MKYENKIFTNCDKTKQFRIVKHKNIYVSKRVIRYIGLLGTNSVGVEKVYNDFNIALKTELKWLKNK